MTANVETLAKLYLENAPAELSAETMAEFCEFIMDEFRQLPLAIQASTSMRYEQADEMFADIEQQHLWVSTEAYGADYPNPFYGFALLAVHDYDHYQTQSDFSLEGEIRAYRATASRAPSLAIQKILYSEIVLKSAAHLVLGRAPEPKLVFA
ncbi:MAG: transposase [Leptolyngbyaceae cyanobacterium SM1_4_3]|nr:transposase [Leptolyngbyaceae cyanobacterium SM1_4_3]NJN90288.1 transposase [Leptolyngbyaceae cyanobacterium SL_5_14]NJO66417.1 transposase [Leptolyngbyaceae cyanobacterium RM1_405_57]